MVFDEHAVGYASRDLNLSDEELQEFERAGLFTKEETASLVVNRLLPTMSGRGWNVVTLQPWQIYR